MCPPLCVWEWEVSEWVSECALHHAVWELEVIVTVWEWEVSESVRVGGQWVSVPSTHAVWEWEVSKLSEFALYCVLVSERERVESESKFMCESVWESV